MMIDGHLTFGDADDDAHFKIVLKCGSCDV